MEKYNQLSITELTRKSGSPWVFLPLQILSLSKASSILMIDMSAVASVVSKAIAS
jgi:hypothetical protein